jgi:hypothetical protein
VRLVHLTKGKFCDISRPARTHNRGLRTLRRALNLAYAWAQIERPVKIELAKGEGVAQHGIVAEQEIVLAGDSHQAARHGLRNLRP